MKKRGLIALKLIASICLLAWLVFNMDLQEVLAIVSDAHVSALVLAALVLLLQSLIGGFRWSLMLRAIGVRMSIRMASVYFWISMFFSQVLPGAIGGDVARVLCARSAGISLRNSFTSVAAERILTLYALFLIAAFFSVIFPKEYSYFGGRNIFILLLAITTLGLLMLRNLNGYIFEALLARIPARISGLLAELSHYFKNTTTVSNVLIVAIIGHLNLAVVIYLIFVSFGAPISLELCLVIVPPILLLSVLPISVGGWGVREAAMVGGFSAVGIGPSTALVVSVTFGLLNMIVAIPGGVLFVTLGGKTNAS
jgi:uncharacterized protein (TIRG00374 family)